MRKFTKRSVAVVAAAVVAVGGGAAAYAAWSANATGSATASTGSSAPVEVTGSQVSQVLVPNNKANLVVTLRNPNNFLVKVKKVEITSITTSKSGCGNGNFAFTKPAITPINLAPVTTAGDTQAVTLTDVVSLIADPNNACQDAPLQINFKVDAESTDV
ncbi:hypothetical protein JIG36_44025 [Actinoplanes sp. LDG1-06]|uniref:Uncharacterized protein n=1 Tax=Paractinoplanes ovalisporus TaxID=2810368 RepID=A0ABS2ARK1_9ACTN|nr:hypothetical protein [Actinoplanes ovalisporus]MBM2622492.1 hypothetical protein [Actinoplanes ovalisporus]